MLVEKPYVVKYLIYCCSDSLACCIFTFMKSIFCLILSFIGTIGFAHAYTVEQLSENPKIFVISNFLTDEECDYVIAHAKPQMNQSVVYDDKSKNGIVSSGRTSTSMRCDRLHGDQILQRIEKRISEVTILEEAHGENLQVVHYETGMQYRPHYDYFQDVASVEGGQRIATFIVYLNTPLKGGQTDFPRAGISITPKKGNALFFYNVDKNGLGNPLTLHAGTPVIEGEKWILNRWFREKQLW